MEGPREATGKRGCLPQHRGGFNLGQREEHLCPEVKGERKSRRKGRWVLGGEKGQP